MSFRRSSTAATPLQAARYELGWTQAQTLHALLQAAADEEETLAQRHSLKTMLSRWENGHEAPDPFYQRFFCRIYGRTPEELGFVRNDPTAIMPTRVAPAVGPEMVEYFRNVFVEHLRADNLMGPHHLVDVVRAQTALLDQMLPSARGSVRRDLLMLAFRYNELAGWLYQDAGNPEGAMRYTDRSMDYALEMDGSREKAYALMRKADIASDLGNSDRVLGLTNAALRDGPKQFPRLTALILRVRARAYASVGDTGECSRSLEMALTEVARPANAPDDLTAYCTPSYIGMEAANCWTKLGRFESATVIYEQSLHNWPFELRRDQGLCLARLMNAYAGREDVEGACAAGRQAVEVIRSATSSRALTELHRGRVRLAPWRRHAEVSDLSDRIRGLIQPAA
jgi:tetratricopeptide (TPR) repeat protein